jgi:hypothetical protein
MPTYRKQIRQVRFVCPWGNFSCIGRYFDGITGEELKCEAKIGSNCENRFK